MYILFALKRFSVGLLALALIVSFTWQSGASPTQAPELPNTSQSAINSTLQTLGGDSGWNIGPVSFTGKYDSLLGAIGEARYAKKFSDDWAMGLIGEYGPNNYRLNGTLGSQFGEHLQVKFTSEYLSQRLPFAFDSGNIKQRVGQGAYGLQFRSNFDHSFFQDIQGGVYWAQAPSVSLPSITLIRNSLQYTNERNLAGSISRGLDIGTDFALSPVTAFTTKLLYDDINYSTRLTSSPALDRSGLGASLQMDQILSDRTKLSLKAEKRPLINTYGGELYWLPRTLPVTLSLIGQRLESKNQPSSNVFGVNIGFSMDNTDYNSLDRESSKTNILSWVKDPAVHMDRVEVQAEQRTTVNGPVMLSLSPASGPITGGGTVTITGTNFLPGVVVTFGGVNATIVSVTSTQIVVTVPDLSMVVVDNTPSMFDRMLAALSPISQAWASPPSTVDVEVINPDGKHMKLTQAYSVSFNPSFTTVSPNSGPAVGGTSVTITGSHFTGATSVTFGGIAGTGLTVNSDTSITVNTPAHAAGAADVVVTTPEGSGQLSNGYTYAAAPTVTGISPSTIYTNQSVVITVTGTNFTGATAVSFGGTTVSYNVDSATSITFSPPTATTGTFDITVTTPGGTSATSSADQFTVLPLPHIIFVTTDTYTGNLGGLSGANQKCNTDPGKPGGFAADFSYKALLSGNNATVSGTQYYRTDGVTLIATATGGNLVGLSSLTHSVNASGSLTTWTGANGNNCSNWTSTTTTGDRGASSSSTTQYWFAGTSTCSTARTLYCVSQ